MSALKKFKIKTRAQHIWIRGVFVFGLVGPLFFNLVYYLLSGEITIQSVVVSVIVSGMTGYLWGVRTWQSSGKKE
jgi:VIT1/CCC1 family predicted Fe2+/Mn2+ transporter